MAAAIPRGRALVARATRALASPPPTPSRRRGGRGALSLGRFPPLSPPPRPRPPGASRPLPPSDVRRPRGSAGGREPRPAGGLGLGALLLSPRAGAAPSGGCWRRPRLTGAGLLLCPRSGADR